MSVNTARTHVHDFEHELVKNLIVNVCNKDTVAKFFLLASPAWGKTTLIRKIYQEKYYKRILFMSPLVALNLEFKSKLLEEKIPVLDLTRENSEQSLKNISWDGVVIATPEKVLQCNFVSIVESWADLIVVDEFHLHLMWQSFRPKLEESWLWLAVVPKNILLLSGTFNWDKWSVSQYGQLWLENAHNYCKLDLHENNLLCMPVKEWIFSSSKKWPVLILLKIILLFTNRFKILIFLPKREQVQNWARWCRKYDLSCLSCVGGMSLQFMEKLKTDPNPSLILSTSVLSHGVNLPARDIIVILGNLWQEELWRQMKSRGGRKGEKYYFLSEKQAWMH